MWLRLLKGAATCLFFLFCFFPPLTQQYDLGCLEWWLMAESSLKYIINSDKFHPFIFEIRLECILMFQQYEFSGKAQARLHSAFAVSSNFKEKGYSRDFLASRSRSRQIKTGQRMTATL